MERSRKCHVDCIRNHNHMYVLVQKNAARGVITWIPRGPLFDSLAEFHWVPGLAGYVIETRDKIYIGIYKHPSVLLHKSEAHGTITCNRWVPHMSCCGRGWRGTLVAAWVC